MNTIFGHQTQQEYTTCTLLQSLQVPAQKGNSCPYLWLFFFSEMGIKARNPPFTKPNRGVPTPSSFTRVFKQSPQCAHDKSWPLKNSEQIRQHGSGSRHCQLEANEDISTGAPPGGGLSKH